MYWIIDILVEGKRVFTNYSLDVICKNHAVHDSGFLESFIGFQDEDILFTIYNDTNKRKKVLDFGRFRNFIYNSPTSSVGCGLYDGDAYRFFLTPMLFVEVITSLESASPFAFRDNVRTGDGFYIEGNELHFRNAWIWYRLKEGVDINVFSRNLLKLSMLY